MFLDERIPFNEEDMFSIFRSFDYSMLLIDKEGKVLFCNEMYLNVTRFNTLGYTTENILGLDIRYFTQIGLVGESAAEKCLREKRKIVTLLEAPLYKLIMSTAVPYFNHDGEIRFVAINVKDEAEFFNLFSMNSKEYADIYHDYLRFLAKYNKDLNGRTVISSKPLQEIFSQCLRVSNSDIPVLVLGESGVGKDVVAKFIHENSRRQGFPFVAINCGAVPENLIESELFGYAPGAFTGASKGGKKGILEMANKGTLLLDEIGDLPLQMQVKLLRVLESKQFTRVGSTEPIEVNFRLISATNKNLLKRIQSDEFRQDLYYRINGFKVNIPPLRERKEDISALALHYLAFFNLKYGKNKKMSGEAMNELLYYNWPGNVRELRSVMEQLVIMSNEDEVCMEYLRSITRGDTSDFLTPAVVVKRVIPLNEAVAMTEKQLLEAVKEVETSSYKAAKILRVDQTTILRKLKKYDIGGFR